MTSASTERRLAAIMFTDIVGYTALMAQDEEAARRARGRHETVVRPQVDRYHGEWIERTGDETLSSFPSALDAVNCALAVQAELDGDADLRLRIGIHQGDVTFDASGVSGDGVNVAARVRPLAEPGSIAISDEVHQSVRGRPNLVFEARGEQQFKNVDHPVAVFAVTGTAAPPGLSKTAARSRRAALPLVAWGAAAVVVFAIAGGWWLYRPVPELAPIRSIAVLPLENLSGDPEQEYVADGMTEALIGELAKLGSLSVISRTSVMRYKHSDKSLPEIAKELGVEGVLEGTVTREGDQVRVTAQLIDARSDTHIWNDQFDRELSGVLALYADVARAVAEQIRLELTPEVQATLTARRRPVDPRAYDAYLSGLRLRGPPLQVRQWGPPAIEQFERSVELDPEFAEGYVALAAARVVLSVFQTRPRGQFPQARKDAERALELDESLGEAHVTLGSVRRWYDWDFPGARDSYQRAWELSPNDPAVLNVYAAQLLREGRTEEALDVSERLLRVAPFDLYSRAQRVNHFFTARQYERALEEVERVRELDADYFDGIVWFTYIMLGRFEEAFRANMAFDERCGAPCDWDREATERGWAKGGWEGSLRAFLEAATKREESSPVFIAIVYGFLSETDEALVWLERGYRERDPLMVSLDGPPFDSLRSDPRFQDLLRRIGFPES